MIDLHGLQLGFAGEFKYYTGWKLDRKYDDYGTITMQMRIRQEVRDKDGMIVEGGPEDIRYAEAWEVGRNDVRTFQYTWVIMEGSGFPDIGSFRADDLFSDSEHSRCTKGWSKFEGLAAYYKNIDIPSDWGFIPYAIGLPSIWGWHDLGEETEGFDIKAISVEWDCISGTCETLVVDIR